VAGWNATTGPISPQLTLFYSATNAKATPHDAAAAKQLLSAAGVSNLHLTWVGDPTAAKLATELKDELSQVGITLDIVQLERNAWIDRLYAKKDFDLSYTNFENGPDPDIGVERMFITSNIGPVPFSNEAAYRNPQVDQLFSQAAQILDRAQRGQIYGQIQEIVTKDIPYTYLVETPSVSAFHSDFKNLDTHNAKSSIYYEDAWWTKGKATQP